MVVFLEKLVSCLLRGSSLKRVIIFLLLIVLKNAGTILPVCPMLRQITLTVLVVRYGQNYQVLKKTYENAAAREINIYRTFETRGKSKWWISLVIIGVLIAVPIFCYVCYVTWKRCKAEVERIMKRTMLISFRSIVACTKNFSVANKLGEGGFGSVYKGTLRDGQEIAIKRLSKRSGQGLVEFKNEAILIAKLQHTSLVRLLGFCVEREERILVYEYMSNKSLDSYLFDIEKKKILNWNHPLNLIGLAWQLWRDNKAMEIIDPSLLECCPSHEALRCVQVGLLCVQDRAADRPSMLEVVSMLSNETASLPTPKQPAFYIDVEESEPNGSEEQPKTYSINEVTISGMDAR
ncbi:hypothetical protein L6164_025286 [Bauhinia variegata]|uniref:Uncharacterized protein n=1 Tax=Bauhinia variegata TaxID=167791 RepID=A0ACB9M1H8_BAUVA|nr:hypothetical protein L6164_025286 [Bauhinia variegata]